MVKESKSFFQRTETVWRLISALVFLIFAIVLLVLAISVSDWPILVRIIILGGIAVLFIFLGCVNLAAIDKKEDQQRKGGGLSV